MRNFIPFVLGAGVVAATLTFSPGAQAAEFQGPKWQEQMLIGFCRDAMNDKVMQLRMDINKSPISARTVASKLICNGEPVYAFAERYGAQRSSDWLKTRLPERAQRQIIQIKDVVYHPAVPTRIVASLTP